MTVAGCDEMKPDEESRHNAFSRSKSKKYFNNEKSDNVESTESFILDEKKNT